MENFNQELLQKARKANSSEELLDIGRENGVELTKEDAEVYFEKLHQSCKLSDEELDNVAGGGRCTLPSKCPKCGSSDVREYMAMGNYSCGTCGHHWGKKPKTFY